MLRAQQLAYYKHAEVIGSGEATVCHSVAALKREEILTAITRTADCYPGLQPAHGCLGCIRSDLHLRIADIEFLVQGSSCMHMDGLQGREHLEGSARAPNKNHVSTLQLSSFVLNAFGNVFQQHLSDVIRWTSCSSVCTARPA